MVNVCGKCKYYTRSETNQQGNYFHYCSKVDELYSPETLADGETSDKPVPLLKLQFNSEKCEYFEKKRR